VESGARNIDQILTQTLLPELSTELLVRMAADQPFSRVAVTLRESGDFAYSIQ
jgi:type VI secretion system protein VasG